MDHIFSDDPETPQDAPSLIDAGSPPADPNLPDPEVDKWLEKDPQTVAQAKVNSDRYIKQLQGELSGLRQELNVRTSLEEYLEAQKERHQNTTQPIQPSTTDEIVHTSTPTFDTTSGLETPREKGISSVDLTNEVKKTLEQELAGRDAAALTQRNLDFVKEKASAALGPEYPYLFSKKAKEMNLDQNYLQEMAKTQPDAFLSLMLGQDYAKTGSGTPPMGSVSAEARDTVLAATAHKGQKLADWNHLKEDPAKYWSSAVQNEIFRAATKAEAEGRDFYSK